MARELINPASLHPAPGFSHITIATGLRTIYTTMPTEFETISSGIAEVTGGAGDPAQTIAGVTGLALPGLLIEVEATASV